MVNSYKQNKINRLGEESVNMQGYKMKIIRYDRVDDMDIQFEDGTVVSGWYNIFKNGKMLNHNHPSVYGVGVFGYGDYDSKKDKRAYDIWRHMINRCYNDKTKEKLPTYNGCLVSDEFLNFQTFAKFYYENKWTDDLVLIPDKDILCHNKNKIYSRDTILFVDNRINVLFTKRGNSRGDLPIGVQFSKIHNKFKAGCSQGAKTKHIGLYNTPEEAFCAYKEFKEKYIKQIADEYREKYLSFPQKLYDAMYSYQVFITD